MASIVKRKSKYSVVYNIVDENGVKRQRWETFASQAEAKKRKAQIEYQQSTGTFIAPTAKTIRELLEEYINIYGINTWALSTYESRRSLVYKGRKVALYGGAYAPSYLPNDIDTFACGVNCGNHQIHHPPLIVKVHFFPCVQIAGNFFDLFRADGVHTQLRYLFDKLLLASVQFFNLAVHIGEQDGICPGQRVNERFNFMLDLCEFYLQGGQLWIGLHSIFSPLDGLERF